MGGARFAVCGRNGLQHSIDALVRPGQPFGRCRPRAVSRSRQNVANKELRQPVRLTCSCSRPIGNKDCELVDHHH